MNQLAIKIQSKSLVARSQRQGLPPSIFVAVCESIDGLALRYVSVQPDGERFGNTILRTNKEKRRALIGSTLVSVGRLFGATGKIESDILKGMVDFVDQSFKMLSVDEIRLAFNMASAGHLEADVSLYGKPINLDWLSRVLRAYKSQRQQVAAIISQRRDQFNRIMNTDERKIQEIRNESFVGIIEDVVTAFVSDKPDMLFTYHFQFLEKIAAIVVGKKEKKEAFSKAKGILVRILRKEKEENKSPKKRQEAEKRIGDIISGVNDKSGRQARQAVVLLLRDWFADMKEKQMSPEQLRAFLVENYNEVKSDLCAVRYLVTVSPPIGADRTTKPLLKYQLEKFLNTIEGESIKIEIK